MKKIFLWGAALSVMAFASCSKNEEMAPIAPTTGERVELQADLSLSRTATDGLSTTWVANDAMKVWLGEGEEYTNCGEFTLPEENLSTGIFTGTLPESYDAAKSYDWYALYPYETANYEAAGTPALTTMLIGTNVQRQTGGYNSIAHISGSVAPLYGVTKGVAANARPNVQMKHLSTLVKIVVTNLDEHPLEVRDITIQSETTKIAGRARIQISNGEPTYDPVAAAATQAILRVTSNEETIAQNGKAEFYVALIPFTVPAEGETFKITVAAKNNDVCTCSFTLPAGTQFKAGELNTFNLKYKAEEIIDLDAEGTANCYIVTKAGHCSFKATKGNSDEVPAGLASVNWLWTTETNLISNLSLASDNEIHFTSAEREGNVVIAGCDADGNIVWSWHIWLTDDPRLNLHSAAAGYYLMDRNLGATDVFDGSSPEKWNVGGYGLFYQWGRKDPFPGPKTIGSGGRLQENAPFTNGTVATSQNENYAFAVVHDTTIGATKDDAVAYTIAHPMDFIDNTNGTLYGQLAWWNSAAADYANLWEPNGKSIYDPCPAGYKVPYTATYGTMDWSHWQVESQVVGSRTIYAYGYTGGDATVRSWYPAMNHRCATTTTDGKQVSGVLSWTGIGAYYWLDSFRTKNNTNRAWVMVADKSSYDNSNNDVKYITASGHNFGFTGRGYPVRCVKINE